MINTVLAGILIQSGFVFLAVVAVIVVAVGLYGARIRTYRTAVLYTMPTRRVTRVTFRGTFHGRKI